MARRTLRLSFKSPVHFGTGRLSDSAYTCDAATLFSALFIEALRMGSSEELLNAARSGRILLSDGFPYIGETHYLPKPMLAPSPESQDKQAENNRNDSRARKAAKKLAYIAATRYESFIKGDFDPIAELEQFALGKSSLRTNVNLLRENGPDSEPYHVGGFSFAKHAGLYFLVEGDFNLDPILDALSYSGIGGKRTTGYGRFEYEWAEDPTPRIAPDYKSDLHILLSSSVPQNEELSDALLSGARYRLVRKGGFVQSSSHAANPQKKRDVYAFAPGSVFPHTFSGSLLDVNATKNVHPVYRFARAMWLEV